VGYHRSCYDRIRIIYHWLAHEPSTHNRYSIRSRKNGNESNKKRPEVTPPAVVTEPIKAEIDEVAQVIVPEPPMPSDCASQLIKYDWPQEDARRIMMKESSNNPHVLNDNPNTGDYSVGCFQINLIGNMRNTRPPEAWLMLAENNVQYAYQMYVAQGRTFCKTSGWINSCRATGVK
jgi:hypothetical protein